MANIPSSTSKRLPLIVAIVAGLLGVFMIVNYMRQYEQSIADKYAPKEKKTVVQARKNIPAGTVITEEHIALKKVPEEYSQPYVVTNPERILGRKAVVDIAEGEQITMSKLVLVDTQATLSKKTPEGKRAVTIPVDSLTSVGGLIRTGDSVDVIATIAMPGLDAAGNTVTQPTVLPLFQNVLVLAVGTQTSNAPADPSKQENTSSYGNITLALGPQEAEFLLYVQEQGKIQLMLRSASDKDLTPVVPANINTLMEYLYGPRVQPPTVEIVRGVNKKEIAVKEKSEQETALTAQEAKKAK